MAKYPTDLIPSPRTSSSPPQYGPTIGQVVAIAGYTDQWGFIRGQHASATITAIEGEVVTCTIPGIIPRQGYTCHRNRIITQD